MKTQNETKYHTSISPELYARAEGLVTDRSFSKFIMGILDIKKDLREEGFEDEEIQLYLSEILVTCFGGNKVD